MFGARSLQFIIGQSHRDSHPFILQDVTNLSNLLEYKQNPHRNMKNMQTPNREASTQIKPFSSEENNANCCAFVQN